MDKQTCDVCDKTFDFDEEGLGCASIIVCGSICAKKSTASRGNAYAIHDDNNKIVESNADGTEARHIS